MPKRKNCSYQKYVSWRLWRHHGSATEKDQWFSMHEGFEEKSDFISCKIEPRIFGVDKIYYWWISVGFERK